MFANQINTYHLGSEAETKHTHEAWLMTHPASEGNFINLEIQSINWFCVYKGIFFISDISHHQGTHLQQSATDKSTDFNLIHDFNWTRKNHATTEEWRMWGKAMKTLCDERKKKLRKSLGQSRLDGNKYITSCQWFLSLDQHIIY